MARLSRCSDAELLARTPTDARAFGVLYERWEGAMLGWLLRRTGDPDVVVDLAAEVFAAALGAADRFTPAGGDESAGPWLFAIARNTLISSLRRGQVEQRARERLAHWEPLDLDGVDVQAIAALDGDGELTHALERLPPAQREAVRLRVIDEREYDEIASELRCSSLVVRKNVSRGLRALRASTESRP